MKRTYFRGQVRGVFLLGCGVALAASLVIVLAWPRGGPSAAKVSLSVVDRAIEAKQVVRASLDDEARMIEIERADGTKQRAAYPTNLGADLTKQLLAQGAEVTVSPAPHTPILVRLLAALSPFILIGLLLLFYMRRVRSGGSSFAKRQGTEVLDTRFSDIGGMDEVVSELAQVRDYLSHPELFAASGARAPRGFLLTGPPGTGKTLLARAVAGESRVPFFALSGSDFVETFAGVGAARVRKVFDLARKRGAAIIFIDEIDAVGKSRSAAGPGGDSDERDRTLNQLLVEMDGFTQSSVIVLAATNRPDLLDAALRRPGRFDRTINVPRPDRRGRTRILELVGRRHTFAPEVDFVELARRTPGMTGADLGALINEAALEATRSGASVISAAHVESALNTTVLGRERPSAVTSDRDRRISAWHEAGHAVCALMVDGANRPAQVTIVPREGTGGATWLVPGDDLLLSRSQAQAQLIVAMGGRAAEEILLDGDFTSGPSDDYTGARNLATQMVTRFGMGSSGVAHVGYDLGDSLPYDVRSAINDLLEDSLASARAVLHGARTLLGDMVDELLVEETLSQNRLIELVTVHQAVLDGGPPTAARP